MSQVSEPWTSECKPADCWPRLFFCLLCALQRQLRSLQLAVAHAHLRGRDAFRKIVVVGCMSHACVGKTEKVRVVEVSDSQQRIDFFSFFSSQTRRDFLKGLGWGEGVFFLSFQLICWTVIHCVSVFSFFSGSSQVRAVSGWEQVPGSKVEMWFGKDAQ